MSDVKSVALITRAELDAVARVIRLARDGYVMTEDCVELQDIRMAEAVIEKLRSTL